MRAEGRCQVCGKPQIVAGYCEVHRDQRLARLRAQGKGGKSCSYCGGAGHNRRSCPTKRRDDAARTLVEKQSGEEKTEGGTDGSSGQS
jgi:hypothetical protein